MAQIIRITSEALQATVRRLLPSQQGFGEDLQASNVIQPIIDLTPTAEGSQLPADFARAIDFSSTAIDNSSGDTTVLANAPGFYLLRGVSSLSTNSASDSRNILRLTEGVTLNDVWAHNLKSNFTGGLAHAVNCELTFFLDTSQTLSIITVGTDARFRGSIRQVADRYGNVTNPTGFTFE